MQNSSLIGETLMHYHILRHICSVMPRQGEGVVISRLGIALGLPLTAAHRGGAAAGHDLLPCLCLRTKFGVTRPVGPKPTPR